MEKQWDIIEVLRHSRHDWLNKLQIIKGNLDLNRIDRLTEVIDQIISEAQHETNLSNLPMQRFAALLLKTNWNQHSFLLDYEVFQDLDVKAVDDAALTLWTASFFSCLDQAIETFHENHLSITIEPESAGIRFFFDFSGIIINKQLIEEFLDDSQTADINLDVKEFTRNELALEAFFPAI